jgi:hypothetical protein
MDNYQNRWKELVSRLGVAFDAHIDLTEALYLIGVQELGKGFREFDKQEKTDLIHVGNCMALSFMGYWQAAGRDADGWPVFAKTQSLPLLTLKEQEELLKKGILAYFESIRFV